MKKVFSSSMLLVYMIIMTCLCESIEEIVNPIKKNHEVCYAIYAYAMCMPQKLLDFALPRAYNKNTIE